MKLKQPTRHVKLLLGLLLTTVLLLLPSPSIAQIRLRSVSTRNKDAVQSSTPTTTNDQDTKSNSTFKNLRHLEDTVTLEEVLESLETVQNDLDRHGFCTDDMRRQLDNLKSQAKEDKPWMEANGDSIRGVATAISGSLTKLDSGDRNQILIGYLDIAAAFSKFVPSPYGVLTGTFSTLIGGVLGLVSTTTSMTTEELLAEITSEIHSAFASDNHERLSSIVEQEFVLMIDNLWTLDWQNQQDDATIEEHQDYLATLIASDRFATVSRWCRRGSLQSHLYFSFRPLRRLFLRPKP